MAILIHGSEVDGVTLGGGGARFLVQEMVSGATIPLLLVEPPAR